MQNTARGDRSRADEKRQQKKTLKRAVSFLGKLHVNLQTR